MSQAHAAVETFRCDQGASGNNDRARVPPAHGHEHVRLGSSFGSSSKPSQPSVPRLEIPQIRRRLILLGRHQVAFRTEKDPAPRISTWPLPSAQFSSSQAGTVSFGSRPYFFVTV